jgi:CMP-N,N'-diacetyllegionaminic acid synthase
MGGERVLGVICARGGSKGLPGKHLLSLAGRPVIAWSVAAAAGAACLSRCVVSTDDPAIAAAAQAVGGDAPFLRPAELATDNASIVDTVLHALDTVGGVFTHVALLQATSPLRTAEDIDDCVGRTLSVAAPAGLTVRRTKPAEWLLRMDAAGRISPVSPSADPRRRQECAPAYIPNGAVYVIEAAVLRRERAFAVPGAIGREMPEERSVDIDGPLDLMLAAAIVAARR